MTTSQPAPRRSSGEPADEFAPALNPEYPTAWWIVALAEDVGRRRPLPIKALEHDLVLWRTPAGDIVCQAAHCLHLGAHLGHGGYVSGGTIQCPFHGWKYDTAGRIAGQVGTPRAVSKLCLPTYRVLERNGVIYLWNGTGSPDHEVPDIYEHYDVSPEKYDTVATRLYLPFPAKWFAENICDAMHFAIAHGAAESGETVAERVSDTEMRYENRLHNYRPWFTWANARRLYRQGELINLLAPLRGNLTSTSFGATLHYTRIENTGKFGNHLVCWTPIGAEDHYFFAVDVMPRVPLRVAQPLARKVARAAIRIGLYSTAVQDAALMRHRAEAPKPPYARFDRGLIAFRRAWDARIESENRIAGDGIHSNGLRAGIRPDADR